MVVNIRKIYLGILRRAIEDEPLRKAVLIEALYSGRYVAGNLNERGVEEFSPDGAQFGSILYRGHDKGKHAFYFVPGKELSKVTKSDISDLVKSLRLGSQEGADNLEVTADHFPWPPMSDRDIGIKIEHSNRLRQVYRTMREERSEVEENGTSREDTRPDITKPVKEELFQEREATFQVERKGIQVPKETSRDIAPQKLEEPRRAMTDEEYKELEKRLKNSGKIL